MTDAEKLQLESVRDSWGEPSEELKTRWNEAWKPIEARFGRYNPDTGYFEGNEEKSITTSQALKILDIGHIRTDSLVNANCYSCLNFGGNLPTLLPINFRGILSGINRIYVNSIRVIDYYTACGGIWSSDIYPMNVSNSQGFLYVSEVKHVLGIYNVSGDASYKNHFYNGLHGYSLETIWVKNLNKGIDLRNHANFRLDCLKYMVENAMADKNQSIVVNANVMAKITDSENALGQEILSLAEEKGIEIVTP